MRSKTPEYKITEIISVASHQLKAPLSVIKGYLEVLISEDFGKLNLKQKEYLEDTLENTERMIRLVKDLLNVSQIEEGRMQFDPHPSSLEKITKEAIREFALLARAKNCTLSLEVLGKIPLLNIDLLKIKQVVNNFISNAIEYNKRGGKVEAILQKKGKKVIFCCEDTGIGISKKEQKKIFKKFYRSEKAMTIITGGSGLGLFISKAIVEKSGGKIWFKSEKDKGSTFCFSLPIKAKIKKI